MKKQHGFTLIELMVVVAIAGIIAAIAYPSYLEQMRKTRRSDCAGALVSLGNAMERWFTVNGTYEGAAAGPADTGLPTIFSSTCPVDGGEATYNLTINAAGPSTYTLHAAPTAQQADDKCGTLTLTNTLNRSITGADAGVTRDQCW